LGIFYPLELGFNQELAIFYLFREGAVFKPLSGNCRIIMQEIKSKLPI